MKIVLTYFASVFSILFCFSQPISHFSPGKKWLDNNGVHINAHGGNVLFHKNTYYWYGEHKLPGKSEEQMADGGIHCYSSKDLMNWKDEGIVLSVSYTDSTCDIAYGCILERPKVIFNKAANQFIVYFKLYPKGTGYTKGYLGVATSKNPNGPFTYQHKSLGAASEFGSGDFSIYDDVKNVYHLTVRKPDKTFVIGTLTKNKLFPTRNYQPVKGVTPHTEAPTVIKVNGKYYLLGSGSSSWRPNTPRCFTTTSLTGVFKSLGNPCIGVNPHNGINADTSFGGQINYILKVEGRKDAYIAMFDIWKPDLAIEGTYIWLPLTFKNGKPVIEWKNTWDFTVFDNKIGSQPSNKLIKK